MVAIVHSTIRIKSFKTYPKAQKGLLLNEKAAAKKLVATERVLQIKLAVCKAFKIKQKTIVTTTAKQQITMHSLLDD